MNDDTKLLKDRLPKRLLVYPFIELPYQSQNTDTRKNDKPDNNTVEQPVAEPYNPISPLETPSE
jgi:hypothetical protein